jgi:hypothetical protein
MDVGENWSVGEGGRYKERERGREGCVLELVCWHACARCVCVSACVSVRLCVCVCVRVCMRPRACVLFVICVTDFHYFF